MNVNLTNTKTLNVDRQTLDAILGFGMSQRQLAWELENNSLTANEILAQLKRLNAPAVHVPSLATPTPAASAPVSGPSVATPVASPPRTAWTPTEMRQRVASIINNPLAKGSEQLAVHLCASPSSTDEAIGILTAARPAATIDASEIYARRRVAGNASLELKRNAQPASDPTHVLSGREVYERRRAAATSRRTRC